MRQIGKYALLLLLAFPAFSFRLNAQNSTKGTVFWAAFMDNLDLMFNGAPRFSFLVSADVNTTGVISLPATGYTQAFTAAAGTVTEVILPAGVFHPVGSETIENLGFQITTDNPVSITAHHQRVYFSDASIVLPASMAGTEYLVMAHGEDSPSGNGMSEFVIVATEDNTQIEITPSVLTRGFRPAGISFSVTLNKGNVYQVQSYSDLTGSQVKVTNGKKIALFSGARHAHVICSSADNHLYDQDYPVNSWGNEYLVISFAVPAGDIFRIMASENGTDIYLNCTNVIRLNRGEYFDTLLVVPVRISSTAPVAVGQFKRSQICSSLGDPTFIRHAPLSLCSKKAVFNSLVSIIPGNTFTNHYVNVLVKIANASTVLLDNNTIAFVAVPQNPDYAYARVPLNPGTHTLVSDSGFYAFAYGFKDYESYSYFLGYDDMRSGATGLSLNFPSEPCNNTALGFSAAGSGTFTSWNWNFGDGNSGTGQSVSHTYQSAGTYLVSLTAIDNSNCPVTTQQLFTVADCIAETDCEIFVPDAFSPDENGLNDSVKVYGTCVKEMELVIYDRWGEIVFRTDDPAGGWDGTYKGQALSNGVFAYTLKGLRQNGTAFTKSGNITLIR